jgi:hypothetical protein
MPRPDLLPADRSGDSGALTEAERNAYWSGFWGVVDLEGAPGPRQVTVDMLATFASGEPIRRRLGSVELRRSSPPIASDARPASTEGPLIAICMATHEPPADLLERQIESIREQTHRRWVCLVSDDCSSTEGFAGLRELTRGDRRFFVSRSPERLGLYRNFERALLMVPEAAQLVALCDQDDRWHPQKLSVLLGHLGRSTLVYSDMRILDERARVVSETFWSYKRNNHTNLASLLLDNTVTGAASLFRRSLLDTALPFPPPLRWSYHDHWLASVALATGSISYVDRPLYDYVQHGTAATPLHPSARVGVEPAAAWPGPSTGPIARRLAEGRIAYFKDLLRVALAARALELRRSGEGGRRQRRAVRRVARLAEPPEPVVWLTLRALRAIAGRNETLNFERFLLKAVAWRRTTARRARRARRDQALSVFRRRT